jgi:SAM-dependent methyltransferase
LSDAGQPPNPETISRLQAGVSPALALLAGMQLDVFTPLAGGSRTAAEVAASLGVREERLSRLLYALVSAGLLRHENGRFANSEEASVFLVRGEPRYMGGSHELMSDLWRADLRTAESIRTGMPAALHDFSAMDDVALAAFLRGLFPFAISTGRELAERFDFTGRASVIDVGGGSGATLMGLLESNAQLRGTVFELSRVASVAKSMISQTAFADRIDVQVGDIVAGPPGGLYDAAILRALVQVLSPRDAAQAIDHACRCLRPGGTIYITGAGIIEDDRLTPAAAAYLNLTLMNFYPQGAAYTVSEHFAWLTGAGCTDQKHVTLSNGSGLIWATKVAA